ncbi:MAG: heme-binding beta-barrel domain-containing protein [Acidimicrobiales bacterium]
MPAPFGEETLDAYGDDLYDEPEGSVDTRASLGPLAPMAGLWEGVGGVDDHPVADGLERDAYVERYELSPIDRQTNGPQLLYGLRYHTHIDRPGEIETFHDQVGYWLWEPQAQLITFSLTIPRGQALLAAGHAAPDATAFEVRATRGSPVYGIVSNPFLDRAFRTIAFRLSVTIGPGDSWSYEQETTLTIAGRDEPFAHRDHNVLRRIGPATANPLAAHEPVPRGGA